jgi:hypothetical protein
MGARVFRNRAARLGLLQEVVNVLDEGRRTLLRGGRSP